MRVILQRSKNSKVSADGVLSGKIESGLVLLSSFTEGDNCEVIDKVVDKIINLRIFSDHNDLMNLSLLDVGGSVLNISQFTLYADISKGRRPSFVKALKAEEATKLYQYMNERFRMLNVHVETGVFGASMGVEIYNDGPITIIIDSDDLVKNNKKTLVLYMDLL